MTSARPVATAAALTATLGLAAGSWVVAIGRMNGIGSSVGLMAMLVALGVMSITWMAVVAVLVGAQKLLPATWVIDVPLALVITGLGIWIVVAPASVPGLGPPM